MSFQKDHVILVNEKDEWLGTMEKIEAHRTGALHRAFSVFVVNDKNEMLLQQRAEEKYHSSGLWSNACCSHPFPGESTLAAAHRRLQEELGFDCPLTTAFHLRYCSAVNNGLTENEYDHIYTGLYNGTVSPDRKEIMNVKYVSLNALEKWVNEEPEAFTLWFRMALPRVIRIFNNKQAGAYG